MYFDATEKKTKKLAEHIEGNITDVERAVNILKSKLGCKHIIIDELHQTKTYVSATLEKFMEIVDERTKKEID